MKHQTVIHFNVAQKQIKQREINQRKEQAKYLNQFRTEFCDMFDISDWLHYSNKTKWSIQKLKEYAKFSNSEMTLKDSVYSFLGSELDEDDIYAMGF